MLAPSRATSTGGGRLAALRCHTTASRSTPQRAATNRGLRPRSGAIRSGRSVLLLDPPWEPARRTGWSASGANVRNGCGERADAAVPALSLRVVAPGIRNGCGERRRRCRSGAQLARRRAWGSLSQCRQLPPANPRGARSADAGDGALTSRTRPKPRPCSGCGRARTRFPRRASPRTRRSARGPSRGRPWAPRRTSPRARRAPAGRTRAAP
jgi:hypothetical protein